MQEKDIIKWGEIQYMTGRLDEIYYKAIPNVTDLHGSRMLDVRLQKYLDKLKEVDEIAYFSYITSTDNRRHDKIRSQKKLLSLLEEILPSVEGEVKKKLEEQIRKLSHSRR